MSHDFESDCNDITNLSSLESKLSTIRLVGPYHLNLNLTYDLICAQNGTECNKEELTINNCEDHFGKGVLSSLSFLTPPPHLVDGTC